MITRMEDGGAPFFGTKHLSLQRRFILLYPGTFVLSINSNNVLLFDEFAGAFCILELD